ncbi:u43-Liphistoxin-Lth1a_1 [Trichonephila clavata]|uniref:U43-Liphistoxin-Lth1a_1 n=1 Tax=Trichonephila clavata TaxID=2740835 RepID=A0A8X6KQZ1_TRICU|nr:u43-Liphistoxin-Lth1a_1 [Trichonephila clavata]
MNWVHVGFLTMLAVLFGSSDGQDRIIFRSDDEDISQGNSVTNVEIPEKLLIQMKDVQNVTEFLSRFVRRNEVNASERTDIYSRRANVRVPVITPPATCQPEMQVVELEKPSNGATFIWPPCVRVPRCGGCCTSKLLSCHPVATSVYNVTVLQVIYNPQTPDAFVSQGTRIYSLEQHDRCSCNCKQDASSCGVLQKFREDECRCVCTNQYQASQCTGPKKIWDSLDCACKCRRIMECSTGSYFNPLECRCETARRSLSMNNLNRQNITTS